MRALTKRMVGADSCGSAVSCAIWAGMTSLLLPASRFISSMTRAVPSLPYRRLMACSTALRVAIMGMMRLREAVLTSS